MRYSFLYKNRTMGTGYTQNCSPLIKILMPDVIASFIPGVLQKMSPHSLEGGNNE